MPSVEKLESPTDSEKQQNEPNLEDSIRSLEEEELQLSEVSEIERTHLIEVVSHLRRVMEPLDTSFHVDPSSISDIIISPRGNVSLISGDDVLNSVSLESLPSETLMRFLAQIVPEINRLLNEKRHRSESNSDKLERAVREFRKVAAALSEKSEKPIEAISMAKSSSPRLHDAMEAALKE